MREIVKRFQYRIVGLGTFNVAEKMVGTFAHLGSNGWELVGIFDKSSNWITAYEKGFALFKREVPEGVEPEGPWAEFNQAANVGKAGQPDDQHINRSDDPNWGAW